MIDGGPPDTADEGSETAAVAGDVRGLRGKKYASSIDVARLAGVSQSAVSRTYRGGASVSEETRRKVLAAAEALDYRPSLIPRIMSTHKSHLVAVVVGGLYNPFYSAVLEQFTMKLQATGRQVLLVHVESGHALDAVLPKLASYRVDAIVSALAVLSPVTAEVLARLRIPVVSFNTALHNAWVAPVSCDNAGAGRAIAALFIARGARSFAFVSGPASSHASAARFEGFSAALREAGFAAPAFVQDDYSYEAGAGAAAALIERGTLPDALFCANDLLAIGAMDTLRQRFGRRIPEDVMVAGFDDIPAASWGSYRLTTFLQDGGEMVDRAIEILAQAEDGGAPGEHAAVIVPARLIERDTTAPRAREESPA